jgi:hypothetical protein
MSTDDQGPAEDLSFPREILDRVQQSLPPNMRRVPTSRELKNILVSAATGKRDPIEHELATQRSLLRRD